MPALALPPARGPRTALSSWPCTARRGGVGREQGGARPGTGAARTRRAPRSPSARAPRGADFADVADVLARGPVNLPIWGASYCRWALEIGRSIPDACGCTWLVWRHRIDVVVVNSTVLVAPSSAPASPACRSSCTSRRRRSTPRGACSGCTGRSRTRSSRSRRGSRSRSQGPRTRAAEPGGHRRPARSGAARAVRRRSGPARRGRHAGPAQAPGHRDRDGPRAA